MPEISRFYGIVIQIYYGDHPPPHSMQSMATFPQRLRSTRWTSWRGNFRLAQYRS